jgi:hypothetical protein
VSQVTITAADRTQLQHLLESARRELGSVRRQQKSYGPASSSNSFEVEADRWQADVDLLMRLLDESRRPF